MVFAQIFYMIAILGGLYGGFIFFQAVNGLNADNVMQQIARVSFALGYAIIPYIIARATELLVLSGRAVNEK